MIEHALEDCLTRMRLEGASPEECLAQYPEYRAELEPMLKASLGFSSLEALEPSAEFRRQARLKLQAHMHANPRRQQPWLGSLTFRYAASLAMLFALLVTTGTALAQRALPGDSLYGWKLASERIWRSVHESPVDLDIYLTGRRVDEIKIIQGRGNLEEIGVGAYTAVLQQLNLDLASFPEKGGGVSELLMLQRASLEKIFANSRGDLPALDEVFSIVVLPVPVEDTDIPNRNEGISNDQLPSVVTAVPTDDKKGGEGGNNASEEHGKTHGQGKGQGGQKKGHNPDS